MELSRPEYWSELPFPFPGIFPTQGLKPGLSHCRWILYQLSHKGSPILTLGRWKRRGNCEMAGAARRGSQNFELDSTFAETLFKVRDTEVKWSVVAHSCLTLCYPMDSSLPGSAIHGIFQARILEWAAISFSRGSSQSRDRTRVSCIADRRFTILATREEILSHL